MKLGSWLIARGKLTGAQLKRALLDQSFYGGHLSSSLMKLGFLDEPTLGAYLADLFQVPYAGPESFQSIPPEVIRMIPEHLAQKHLMVPLLIDGKKLRLAMMNPADILVMDEVAFLTGMQVEPRISSESHLLDALERYYQIPRSVRETIPLANQTERRTDPRMARRHMMEVSDAPDATIPAPPPHASAEEVGLDGRPLSASPDSVTELYPATVPAPPSETRGAATVPRSLEEWRSAAPGSASPEAGAVGGGAPSPPRSVEGAPESTPHERRAATSSQASGSDTAPSDTSEAHLEGSSAPKRPQLSLVPSPAVMTLEQVSENLKSGRSRDEIFEAMLEFSAARFVRTAVFLVAQDKVVGFSGRGDGFDLAKIRSVSVGLETPSIFSYFRAGSEFYYGPVPGLPANLSFYRSLALTPPERVLLLPISIKERLIALLYGDLSASRREDPDVAVFRRLVQKAILALEILILRNKIGMI